MKFAKVYKILIASAICLFSVSAFSCRKKSSAVSVNYSVYNPSTRLDENGQPDTLCVNFDGSVSKLTEAGSEPSSQITITPQIAGKWVWVNDSQLRFIPHENWLLGTRYKVSMPSAIFSEDVNVKSDFSFKTENFVVSLEDAEFYINPENPKEKRVTATIYASYPMVKESVAGCVTMSLDYYDANGKSIKVENVPFKLSYNKSASEAYLVSDLLPIPPYTSALKVKMGKGIEAQVGGKSSDEETKTVSVPGMSDFVKIESVDTSLVKNQNQNYDQMLVIETKGSVAVDELASCISVFELPKDRPEMEGWDAAEDAFWSTNYVTDKILKISKKIELSPIPTAEPAADLNSFGYKATPGHYLYVKIEGGINFFGGYKLRFYNETNSYETIIKVPEYPKELSIMSEGTILSLSGSRKMALYSRGIKKVYYRLSRIMPKDVNHLVSMSNGDMKNFHFEHYSFNENNIAESETSSYWIPDYSISEISYFSYDFSDKLRANASKNLKNGLFLFQVAENENSLGRDSYYSGKSDKRLILVTDLGFIIKKNTDGTRDVFVQSISNGNPVSYATVKVVGLNGNVVAATTTDSSGHAKLPAISNYSGEHRPTAYVVETANDLSFMPYSENGRSLDYSNYDVGGEYGASQPDRITAYMFSDRGMYRPGETAHIALIAKAGNWNIDLRGTPIEAEVTDSNGSVVFNKKLQLSSAGFEEIDFPTQDYSPTGNYTVNLYLLKEYKNRVEREYLASETIKLEEFLPDTLSISAGFDPLPENGWINPSQLKGTVSLKNLFGTPAAGNDIKGQMFLTPGFPVLYRYSDYYFADPFYKGKSFDEFLGTKQTDDAGKAEFDLNLSKFEKATYRLQFYAEGYEKGSGRSVSSQASLYVSPLKYLIGYKADGSLGYINSNSVRKLSFIAIDQKLNKIDLEGVTLKIEEIRYISTLVKQSNGLYKYQSVKKSYPVNEKQISISKNGTDFIVPSDAAGEFKLTLADKDGLIFNTINYTIVGDKNVSRSLTRTAELELKLQSGDLNPGSTAEIFIKAPYAGTGLITIERDHVYTYKWFKTNELSSVQYIRIPEELEGNGYINVMFTRDSASNEIFMSPFCYGAIPFSVGRGKRTNNITLKVPDEIKSGSDLTISYSSSDSGKIAIFAIDEGILQVAKYSTPNPLAYFFKKRALEVRTSQILDLILPEYNVLKTLSATGGGAEMEMLAKNLNPFKRRQNASVAYWSGIIETGPESRSVKYHVPDYFNGSLRVMAVSVSKDKIGVAQVSTIARNPIIIVPNAPLAAAPGDEFDVSVTVTNNHKGSGKNNILLKAIPASNLEIIGESSAALSIEEGKDAVVEFKVKAKNVIGASELKFTATDASESCTISSTLSVRPSMPYQVWISAGSTKKASAEVDVNHRLYEEFATRDATVSNVPTTFLDGLKFFLEKYPYGCAEQITSKSYPYLYEDFVKAGGKTHADAEKIVSDTIGIIQSRMKSDGNIGYWTSKSPVNPFITLYCAEFLTDAQNNGFYVPVNMMNQVLSAVKGIAEKNDDSSSGIYHRSYAIYILTKNSIVTTSYIEKLEEDMNRKNFSATDYEGLYLAASYSMLKQDKKANAILQKVKNKKTFDSSWIFQNGLHYISTYIDIIASYFPSRISDIKANEVEELCNYLDYSYYSTSSAAAAVRAFESYAYTDKSEVYKALAVTGEEQTELELKGDAVLKGSFSDKTEKIKFTSDKSMPMFYGTIQAGFEKEIPSKEIKEGLEVSREYLTENGSKASSFKVGDTVTVKISFRSTKGVIANVALVAMSPAGLETQIQSIRNSGNGSWTPDYVDIREDRVVIYGTVTDKVNTFAYKAKAVNSGTFVVPPMFAENMYNKKIRALSPSPAMKIEKAR